MFTIKATRLAAILDQAAPHRRAADDDSHDLDVLILDSTPRHLHAIGRSERTLAVARTAVAGDEWTARLGYDDAAALRGWLDSSDVVTVEHITASGHQQLRFTEGPAQITVPAASHTARLLPWRTGLRLVLEAHEYASASGRPVQLSADDLALWQSAAETGEAIEFRSQGAIGTLVTAGPDFLGLQIPHHSDGPVPDGGWASSLRTRLFLHNGFFLEVGGRYVDATGTEWVVTARPRPGEEPQLVTADYAAVVLPISAVLAVGEFLVQIPR